MHHAIFILSLGLAALLFALVEIQIEGPNGWAASLPTWRIENRWTRLFYSSKPLTGYHLYTQLFTLVVLHLPFGLGLVPPTWRAEARVLSFFVLFWVLEDFLWFVFNPAFGIKRFRREHVWWHAPTWWWVLPRDYWIFTPIGVALYILSHRTGLQP
jgi:hypothetical protein